ncbi:MAG: hypothetical protein AAFU78_21655 [Cyanobacteria bacterium J06633_2]
MMSNSIPVWSPANQVRSFSATHRHSHLQRWANEIEHLCMGAPDNPPELELQWWLALRSAAAMVKRLPIPGEKDYWVNCLVLWCEHCDRFIHADLRNPRILSEDERTLRLYAQELCQLVDDEFHYRGQES